MGVLKGILYLFGLFFMLWITISTYSAWKNFIPKEYFSLAMLSVVVFVIIMIVVTIRAFKH